MYICKKKSWLSLALLIVLSFYCCLDMHASSSGPKPQWVSKGETTLNAARSNDSYYFKVIQNVGSDLQQLRKGNTNALADFIGKQNNVKGLETIDISNRSGTEGVTTKEDYNLVFKNEFSTDAFYASLVDEYWEVVKTPLGTREYHYYALYAVSTKGDVKPNFDRFEVTRNYGALPAVMSVIPGVGQLYKGQTLKGAFMLGGAAIGAGAIILCENRRAYYQTRIIEEPKFARDYNKKSGDWETGRNLAIGVTGALMVWSVIDAAVTPGATRIRVSPATSLSFRPTVVSDPNGINPGISLALNF